jgi:ankyrin repeat protein
MTVTEVTVVIGKQTPLIAAILHNHVEIVKLLLDAGARTDIHTDNNVSPLFLAAMSGNLAIVQMLVDKGANVFAERTTDGATPSDVARALGHEEIANFIETHYAII